jgi:hypothetical protein
MPSYAAAVVDAPEWARASPEHPCPVCGAIGECNPSEGGESALCPTTVPDWPALADERLRGPPG